MSISNILNISKLGLFANQEAMSVTSNNVTNANTPGYSAQTAKLQSIASLDNSRAASGNGVLVTQVTQNVSAMLENQLAKSSTQVGQLTSQSHYLPLIENIFNQSAGGGLSTNLNDFFTAIDTLANNPTDATAQAQVVLSAGTNLTTNIQQMYSDLSRQGLPVDQEISSDLNTVNSDLQNLKTINQQIVAQQATAQPATDLKDQRQQLIDKLSGQMGIQTIANANGGVTIQTTSGQLLMDGDYAAHLSRGGTVPSNIASQSGGRLSGIPGVTFQGIAIDNSDTHVTNDITDAIENGGGQIGGLLQLRDQVIYGDKAITGHDGLLKQLNQISDQIRYQTNKVSSQAVGSSLPTSQTGVFTLGGDLASPISQLISDPNSRTYSGTPQDLAYAQGTGFSVLSTTNDTVSAPGNGLQTGDAVTLSNSGGALPAGLAPGTTYYVRAVDPSTIAFYDTAADAKAGGDAATGGRIHISSLGSGTNKIAGGSITLAYGADENHLQTVSIAIDPNTMSITDVANAFSTATHGAITAGINTNNQFQITGTNNNVYGIISDTSNVLAGLGMGAFFTGSGASDMGVNPEYHNPANVPYGKIVDANGDPAFTNPQFENANNSGALALSALRSLNVSITTNGSTTNASLPDQLAGIVSTVGTIVQNNQSLLTTQTTAQTTLQNLRDSFSGVSMEDELTNVIKFQQAFAACGKMVTTADNMFQTVLQMVK